MKIFTPPTQSQNQRDKNKKSTTKITTRYLQRAKLLEKMSPIIGDTKESESVTPWEFVILAEKYSFPYAAEVAS